MMSLSLLWFWCHEIMHFEIIKIEQMSKSNKYPKKKYCIRQRKKAHKSIEDGKVSSGY